MIELGTKAETLEQIRPLLKKSRVLPICRFTVAEWSAGEDACLRCIEDSFKGSNGAFIVRSSSLDEDLLTGSNAGKFMSVAGVLISDRDALRRSIDAVVCSYGVKAAGGNQVFLQPMVRDVRMSGVVFTRDLDTLAPYYIINYDEESARTDSVTSGRSNKLKTFIKFRNYKTKFGKFEKLMEAIREVEEVCKNDCLDIEFAIDGSGQVHILQVRAIVRGGRELPKTFMVGHYLHKIHMKVDHINAPHPYLHGSRTYLGVMPDWNPAEMIGVKPRPLALSLYKELITDKTWSYQRDDYGYRNVRSYPLLLTLIGHPYIDVRVSFNSFIPKGIDEDLAARLADYYLGRLHASPSSHDKVEFDIIFSCFFLGLDEDLKKLKGYGFSDRDLQKIKDALVQLTNNILTRHNGIMTNDLRRIEELKERQRKVLGSGLNPIEKIYWLVEDCCRYGTLPFAGLARAGFIAVQFLRSMVKTGLISSGEFDDFMASLDTVTKRMASDRRELSKEAFLERYGHLRPGTYDILSPSYREGYELYFSDVPPQDAPKKGKGFSFSSGQMKVLGALLREQGIKVTAEELIVFLRQAIEGREYSKFIFTKSVSDILGLIKELAAFYEFSPEDASFIDIQTLLHLYATLDHRDLSCILDEEIKRNRDFYEITKMIKLPSLIVSPDNAFEFELEEGRPNFITLGRAKAEVVQEGDILTSSLDGKVVLIPSADPGYDWIFTKKLAGLVTMYGGANSHMAIRAAELRIPSVIGAGEKNYRDWSKAKYLEIDCANQQVTIFQ